MEKSVLSWCGRGALRDWTVGPSLAAVWVVVMMGTEKASAKVRSFWVVVTLEGDEYE